MDETPTLIPLFTETPTETPAPTDTLSPTLTPPGMMVYTVAAPGSNVGQDVVFRYEMTAGDVAVSVLLFGVLIIGVVQIIMGYWKK